MIKKAKKQPYLHSKGGDGRVDIMYSSSRLKSTIVQVIVD